MKTDILAVLSFIKREPRRMIGTRFTLFFVLAGSSFAPFGVALSSTQETPHETNRTGYSGDASCIQCHQKISKSYQHTPHHLTSQLPTANSVLGSFRNGANTLTIVDDSQSVQPRLQFRMESTKDGFFETAITGWKSDVFRRTEPIDLVTGSGQRGQTYLYWQRDRLFELPVSYWSDGHRWINSPGYINGTAEFSRPVNPACLECHSTYVRALSTDPATNRYDRGSLIPGISCETCHGPGANHVRQEAQRGNTSNHSSQSGILNPAKFSRDRQVDLCAECHNGIQRKAVAPTFSYVPGQPLSDFFEPLPSPDVEHPDVHGNQVGLLQRSKCYRSSAQMSCSTCHDVHLARQSAEFYSQKCLTCHQWQSCGVSKTLGQKIVDQCVHCHMPTEETNVIVSQTAGQVVHAKMRNHWIKIYPNMGLPETGASLAHP